MNLPDRVSAGPDDDDDYDSGADEDFNVDARDDDDLSSASSSSDDERPPAAQAKPRKPAPSKREPPHVIPDELDSGDEATIRESRKSKKRKAQDEEDSGGEGGLIKTRAQRRAETQEKQELRSVDRGDVTVDVEDLWAKLSSAPVGRRAPAAPRPPPADEGAQENDRQEQDGNAVSPSTAEADGDMITIKRTYDFAGQTITEEKRVHKSSAEAKLYLSTTNPPKATKPTSPSATTADAATADGLTPLRRPLRRTSAFEPNPTGEVKGLPAERQRLRTPSRADVLAQQKRADEETAKKAKAQKLNTVQKSAIDWAAHVDDQGYQEELDEYGRSKQGYLGKMDFLRGVEGRAEEEGRKARLAQA
ncbi:hypothetical protein MBLNU459_g3684t1 [Dothideomycetes sp. NU459]